MENSSHLSNVHSTFIASAKALLPPPSPAAAHSSKSGAQSLLPRLSNPSAEFVLGEHDEDDSATTKADWQNLIPLPALFDSTFGTADQRTAFDVQTLTRTKPEQRLFGYAKDYLALETGRLANGYKRLVGQRDQLALGLEEAHRKRETLFKELERAQAKSRAAKSELARKLHDSEARAAAARRQAGLAKGQVLKGEEVVARATLAEEEAKATLAAVEAKAQDALARESEAKKRAETAEAVAASSSRALASAREALKEAVQAHEREHARLKEDVSRDLAVTQAKLVKTEEQLSAASESLKACSQAKAQLEQESAALSLQAERASSQLATYKERCDAAEQKLSSRDGNLEKALLTLGQNQQFSQERMETLSKDKARLEARVDELLGEAKTQTQRLFEATAAQERARDKTEALTDRVAQLEARAVELEAKALQAAVALEEARTDAASKTARLSEARDATERALEQASSEKARADGLASQAKTCHDRAAGLDEELAVCKFALEQQRGSMQGGEGALARLLEQAKEAEHLKRNAGDASSTREELVRVQRELEETKERLRKADAARRALHDEVQSLRGNIRVVARVRPRSDAPGAGAASELRLSVDGQSLVLDVAGDQLRRASDKPDSHAFSFNRVFAPEASQHAVFDEVGQLVQSALDGYNVCLFSYGQTGSGKTYTMMGDMTSPVHRGIVPRSVDQVLRAAAESRAEGWEYAIEATFVEIYNEAVRDLLALDAKAERLAKHEIVHHGGEVFAKGVRRVAVTDADQVHALLALADRNRSVAATDKNLESSRSHSVFTMHLVGRNPARGRTAELVGSLSLCDLAGSERLKTSHAQDERLKETQAINTSLSALSTVFTSLAQKAAHVPFRNSALTHLLSPCLSGDGKTFMIVNLSADHCDAAESLCSLRFAQTVNRTELGRAKKNVREGAAAPPPPPPAGKDASRARVNSMQ